MIVFVFVTLVLIMLGIVIWCETAKPKRAYWKAPEIEDIDFEVIEKFMVKIGDDKLVKRHRWAFKKITRNIGVKIYFVDGNFMPAFAEHDKWIEIYKVCCEVTGNEFPQSHSMSSAMMLGDMGAP